MRFSVAPRRVASGRCQANESSSSSSVNPSEMRDAVDKATKKEMTRGDILHHLETDHSEKRSVFGAVPNSGSSYPRPEIERRPETGDRSLGFIFAFDGAAPETIYRRLAGLGFVWAFFTDKASGLTVMEQLFRPGSTALVFFLALVQIVAYASLVLIVNGESTDARSWGPFNAKTERWNGRLAMIGFAALLIDEMMRQSPVFH